ncbi:MAG: cytochrome b/b6 domain-containing protein [Burkholderiales bacterium]|nr:cytochrome b/b6 domain-containing protein [Burkholderiales bacterium]
MIEPHAGQTAIETVSVAIWDLPVRIVHWALVVLIAASWVTSEIAGEAMTYHLWCGYAVLTLVIFRIVWGFAGSAHARFSDFVYGPVAVARYVGGLLRLDAQRFRGHNPAGGWSVIALLLCLLVQALTGLFTNDEISVEGPLTGRVSAEASELLSTIHRWNFYVLMAFVCLHIAAVLFYWLVKRENLIGAMITGRKRLPADGAIAPARGVSLWLAAALLGGVAALVAAVVNSA